MARWDSVVDELQRAMEGEADHARKRRLAELRAQADTFLLVERLILASTSMEDLRLRLDVALAELPDEEAVEA